MNESEKNRMEESRKEAEREAAGVRRGYETLDDAYHAAENQIAALQAKVARLTLKYDPELLGAIERKEDALFYKGVKYVPAALVELLTEAAKNAKTELEKIYLHHLDGSELTVSNQELFDIIENRVLGMEANAWIPDHATRLRIVLSSPSLAPLLERRRLEREVIHSCRGVLSNLYEFGKITDQEILDDLEKKLTALDAQGKEDEKK